jgi:hypothetical protein
MMKVNRIFLFAIVFSIPFFFLPTNSFPLNCAECLKGLEGIEILVEEVKGELEDYNLTAIQIQTDVEAKLRESQIKILSKEENEKLQPSRKPYLFIKIHSRKMPWKREVFAYNIELTLKQLAVLPDQCKSSRKYFYAPTWSKNIVGAIIPKELSEIREGVQQLMDKFIKAYLDANSRS